MELLFLAQATPAAPSAGRVFSDLWTQLQSQVGPILGPLLLWIALLQIIMVVAYWLISKAVARRRDYDDFGEVTYSTFKNAVKVYVLHFLLALAAGVGFALALPTLALYAAAAKSTGAAPAAIGLGTLLLSGGAALLIIAAYFLVPMRIYRIGFVRALLFLVLVFLLAAGGQWMLGRVMENPFIRLRAGIETLAKKIAGPRPGFMTLLAERAQETAFADLEKTAADRSKGFPERHEALKGIYAKLEAARTRLTSGDAAAASAYEARRARYEELLTSVRADFAAQQPSGQTPTPQ